MHPSAMHRRIGSEAPLALAVAVIVGCGADAGPPSAQPIEALGGPWQALPFAVGDEVIQAAVLPCLGQHPAVLPPGATLSLADVRGGGRIDLFFVASGDLTATCTVSWSGAEGFALLGGGPGSEPPPPGPGKIEMRSSSTAQESGPNGEPLAVITAISGRVGAGVAGVDVRLGPKVIRASTANTWFAAWWPRGDLNLSLQPLGPDGLPLGPPQPQR